ncbi:polysaccharide biosynthesis/export family protein [Flavobacterium enshiense]|uniref:polysaccharide biosynthesis/export family protein n=1 Tax=Flavobacterium enshiense TaxID=1341165 RepID=UPI00345D59A5
MKKIVCLFLLIFLASCASRKNFVYLNDVVDSKAVQGSVQEPKIQSDDLLYITVSAENPEVAAPYNLKAVAVNGVSGSIESSQNDLESYLVDKNGEIDFPQVGKIKVGGLSRLEAVEKIKQILADYIQQPVVHIRIINFKISVLGEVNMPGTHTIRGERITLLEALSKSGDLTIYGKRKNVTIIREIDGVKTISKVDLTDSKFIESPYYYLMQNDVVYVEPNNTKIHSSAVGPNLSLGIAILSATLTAILVITRI